MSEAIQLRDLALCFEGSVPAAVATVSGDGVPNITYLSRVRPVDDERVALSNQFFSKTARNLADNPRASLMLINPVTYDEYRLTLAYERTDRRGPVFDRLRDDVDALAAIEGMQDVFKLRAADIYRVLDIEQIGPHVAPAPDHLPRAAAPADPAQRALGLAELTGRLSRCPDLDTLLNATVEGLSSLLAYEHSLVLLLDEDGSRLFTIASHGYDDEGVGSEVTVGKGLIGMAAMRCQPMRLGNLRQMGKYSRRVRQSYEDSDHLEPGTEIPVPGLGNPDSRVAVPAMAMGELVGVLVVESAEPVAFDETDEAILTAVAAQVATAVELSRGGEPTGDDARIMTLPDVAEHHQRTTHVRFFAVDGSTFLDGDYLIKGVAGRILWSLLGQHEREGRVEFTNKEVRLDPSLELPGLRDNLESRLLLLKRRLDEREAPIRIERTGRGRFRLLVDTELRLDAVDAPD